MAHPIYNTKPIPGLYSPCNDEVFKNILGNENEKDLMIDFINAVFEGRGEPVKDVSLVVPGKEFVRIPTYIARVDILATTINNHKFIVEMQNTPTKYFIERCMLYLFEEFIRQKGQITRIDPKLTRQLIEQGILDQDKLAKLHELDMKDIFYIEDYLEKLKEDDEDDEDYDPHNLKGKKLKEKGLFKTSYESLYPVRLIGILNATQFHNRPKQYISHYRFIEEISGDLALDKVSCTFLELDKFARLKPELSTRLDKWMYLFSQGDKITPEQFQESTSNDKIINRAYSKLITLSYTQEQQRRIKRIQDIMDDAIDEAIVREREKMEMEIKHQNELHDAHRSGHLEGREKGAMEAKVEAATNAIKLGLTIEQAAAISGLTIEEVGKLRQNGDSDD